MMKKIVSVLFVAGVLALSLALAAGILFAGPSEPGANERLADAPSLTNKDGSFNADILSDTADWLGDHFFLRQELISANNWLTGKLFGVSASEDVILGSGGWLYYGSTLDDYTGQNRMSDREIFSAAKNLALMQEACEAEGRAFSFMIAPNKNSLYGENMPDYGVAAAETDAQRLMEQLSRNGVDFVDLFAAFGAEEEILYFAHDSHWNSKGAALGADAVNEAFGRSSSYYDGDFTRSQSHAGDLYEMLYPAFTDTETNPVYGGPLEFTYESSANKPDSITLLTAGAGEGSLLCYRDSFGNLLYPYLADSFGAARFSRSTAYDLTLEADYVLVELVERNLTYLISNLPVFSAPRRQVDLPEAAGVIALDISGSQKPEGTQLVEGTLPETADVDSPVYIVCGDGTYEACCLKDNGFGAYIPADENVEGVAYYAGSVLKLLTLD